MRATTPATSESAAAESSPSVLPPNYESPADANTDNTYMVMVKANDGTNDAMKAVTVVVTNVEEPGRVTLSATQPTIGKALMATLADPDSPSGVTVVAWQWASQNDDGTTYTDITGANDAAYTPLEADVGKILRATASYTDGEDSGKSAKATSANPVTAADTRDLLLVEYDPDGDGEIEKADMRRAVVKFFADPPTLTRAEMRSLVAIYFLT